MPVDRRAALQLGLLILAVPAQYFITQFFSNSESQRVFEIKKFVNKAIGFQKNYLSWKSWHRWCTDILGKVSETFTGDGDEEDLTGESPAVEVLKFRDPQGFFGGSVEPRSPRPPNVKYRIGQVIKHKRWGYRGVIIGWDETARAPADWIKEMHGVNKHWKDMPNYAILVDTRDRMTPQLTYVPQENIEIITKMTIMHPSTDHYFEGFDGAQYLPRPWLRAIYPHD